VRGVVLVIALIGMVAMSIAAAWLVRSATAMSQVAGNIAMRQSVERVAAIGFEMALNRLAYRANDTTAVGLEKGWNANNVRPVTDAGLECSFASNQCWYYPRELLARDSRIGTSNALPSGCVTPVSTDEKSALVPAGVPVCMPVQPGVTATKAIDWFDDSNFKPITSDGMAAETSKIPKGYKIRYIIDRQCAAQSINTPATWNPSMGTPADPTPPTLNQPGSVNKFCRTREATNDCLNCGGIDNNTKGSAEYATGTEEGATITHKQIYYRVTVQVIGPRATVHFSQAVVLI